MFPAPSSLQHACNACQQDISDGMWLCDFCRNKLPPGRKTQDFYRLYRYEGLIRDWILAAKVRNESTAYHLLVSLFLQHPDVESAMKEVVYVMPAPSSLWGRFHGKRDIPWGLCERLASYYHVKMLAPPFVLRWRWKKQAHQPRRTRNLSAELEPTGPANPDLPLLLVLDDVVTSGGTLLRMKAQLQKRYRLRFLTLATAR
jgi:predicted amidophosphoribosyltransferase